MDIRIETSVAGRIRALLLELARSQEDMAAEELAATPYWSSTPTTVLGHRDAALALRTAADELLAS
ncbi:hypothetical protein [Nocardioides ultimimeridianus]